MKRLILAASALLFAAPAFAQQPPTPEQYVGSLQVEVSDGLTAIKTALVQRDQKIAELMKQAQTDKKTIADLTAKVPAEKADPAPPK
jgi:phage I-like protein